MEYNLKSSDLNAAVSAIEVQNVLIYDSFHAACASGDFGTLRSILGSCTPEERHEFLHHSNSGTAGSPIMDAIFAERCDVVEFLVDNGYDIEMECDINLFYPILLRDKVTALCVACAVGHTEIARLLLEKGAEVNHCSQHSSPLIYASEYDNVALVQLLLEYGADIHCVPKHLAAIPAVLPLYQACIGGYSETAEVLLSHCGPDSLSVLKRVCLLGLLGAQCINRHDLFSTGLQMWKRALDEMAQHCPPGTDVGLTLEQLYIQGSADHIATPSGGGGIGCGCGVGVFAVEDNMVKGAADILTSDANITQGQDCELTAKANITQGQDSDELTAKANIAQGQGSDELTAKANIAQGKDSDELPSESNIAQGQDCDELKAEANNAQGQGGSASSAEINITPGQSINNVLGAVTTDSAGATVLKHRHQVFRDMKLCTTVEELDAIAENEDMLRLQGLLVLENILGPSHHETAQQVSKAARHALENNDLSMTCKLFLYILEGSGRRNNTAVATEYTAQLAELLLNVFTSNPQVVSGIVDIVDILEAAIEFTRDTICKIYSSYVELCEQLADNNSSATAATSVASIDLELKKKQLEHIKLLTELTETFIGYICIFLTQKFNNDHWRALCVSIHKVLQLSSLSTKPSFNVEGELLKLAVYGGHSASSTLYFFQETMLPSVPVLECLLHCGIDVDRQDMMGNTALHHTLNSGVHVEITELLIQHGAHVDISNHAGQTPLSLILKNKQFAHLHVFHHMTLKCLAATAVMRFRVQYKGQVPKVLDKFILLHGIPENKDKKLKRSASEGDNNN